MVQSGGQRRLGRAVRLGGWGILPGSALRSSGGRPFLVHHAVHKVRGQADVAVRNRIARAGRYHPAVLVEVRQEIPQLRLALDALLVGVFALSSVYYNNYGN